MESKTALFTVFSQKLAGHLMQQGFMLIRIIRDPDTGFNKFLFRNTDALHTAISQWHTNR